jgi:hypothetical protein
MTLPCGCCQGIRQLSPAAITNPPNASALNYRVGTHASFFESMVARLSQYDLDPLQPLEGLTTRLIDDPSIALLDAWAVVADVLTFYQERIANEGYLPTATERRSIMELAALVGYALRPGVAASGYLAFVLQDGYDADVPPGTRAQTLPGPGEVPEAFETGSLLAARAEWNALQPRQTKPQIIGTTNNKEPDKPIYLKGTATNLKPNDPLLLVWGQGTSDQDFRRVMTVTPEPAFNRTKVELQASATTAATAAVSRAGGELITRHLDPASVASPQSEMGRAVVDILRKAEARRITASTPTQLVDWFRETLDRLRQQHRSAQDRGYKRLEEWIRGVIGDFEALERLLPPVRASAAIPRSGHGTEPEARPAPWPSLPARLDALLGALSKPPSTPPASASLLFPTLQEVFAPGSDQQVEFLAALRPAAGSPYRALANAAVTPPSPVEVYALRLTSPLFGHAAPLRLLVDGRRVEWPIIEYDSNNNPIPHEDKNVVDLEGAHPEVLPDSWIVVRTLDTTLTPGGGTLIAKVKSVDPNLSRADYGISGAITRIELDPGGWIQLETKDEAESATYESTEGPDEEIDERDDFDAIRWTVVSAHPELLPQAEAPMLKADGSPDDVKDDTIELGRLHEGLKPGRWLVVTGDRTDIPGTTVPGGELVMLSRVEQSFDSQLPGDRLHSTLHLASALSYTYARGSATVYGNVAPATNGEAHREVLGSGDGSRASQEFTLRHPFLTYIPARNDRGMASTLQVLVGDIPWQQVESLAALGPRDHVFTTRTSDEGKTTVTFGDGHHGARLPSGSENVVAIYRTGSGKAFEAPAGKISLLATKPLGVKGVVNPLDVASGSGPEPKDSGRRNAPLGVAPLDRLVSVHDYEEFSLGFGGVGKASATELWDGRHEIVHVTIAGMDDRPLPADSQTLQSLETALQLSGDRAQPLLVAPREFLFLVISANVTLAPGFDWDTVAKAIRQRLLGRFGFDARDFAQDVVSSDVISAVQSAAGVESVQLVILDAVPETITAAQLAGLVAKLGLRQRIRARLARLARRRDRILPAQLCVLNPDLKGTLLLTKVAG